MKRFSQIWIREDNNEIYGVINKYPNNIGVSKDMDGWIRITIINLDNHEKVRNELLSITGSKRYVTLEPYPADQIRITFSDYKITTCAINCDLTEINKDLWNTYNLGVERILDNEGHVIGIAPLGFHSPIVGATLYSVGSEGYYPIKMTMNSWVSLSTFEGTVILNPNGDSKPGDSVTINVSENNVSLSPSNLTMKGIRYVPDYGE